MGKADFDMEEYDKAMAAAFNDDYYEVSPIPTDPGLSATVDGYQTYLYPAHLKGTP